MKQQDYLLGSQIQHVLRNGRGKKRRITVSKTVGIAGVTGGVLAVEVVINRSFLQGEGFLYS